MADPTAPASIIAPEYRKTFIFLSAIIFFIGGVLMTMSAADARISSLAQKTVDPALVQQKASIEAVELRLTQAEKRVERTEETQQKMLEVLTEIRGDVKYLKQKVESK
jgi:hypothetical protein